MTTPTLNSVYPRPVEDLLPAARELADRTGELPSRNRLMQEFKVGAPKAKALLDALQQPTPTGDGSTAAFPADGSHPAPSVTTTDTPTDPDPDPTTTPAATDAPPADPAPDVAALPVPVGHPDTNITPNPAPARAGRARRPVAWPVLLLALPAFVAIWSGWVELGELAGFGVVNPLPGIWDSLELNTAITLPIGVETYAAYALWVWLSGRAPAPARRFAKWSALGSLVFGAAGQIAYHLMTAAGMTVAPWWITTAVACLPVAVLGMGAALAHLLHTTDQP